jgi:hypothetical protein
VTKRSAATATALTGSAGVFWQAKGEMSSTQ